MFLKVCAAADNGQSVTPETIKAIDSQETEQTDNNGKEWKQDFDNNGKILLLTLTLC